MTARRRAEAAVLASLVLVLLAGGWGVASVETAAAADIGTGSGSDETTDTGTSTPTESSGSIVSTVTNATEEAANETANETAGTISNETGEVVNETGEVVNETKDIVNETTDVVNQTGDVVNETADTVNETVENVSETADQVTNETDDLTDATEETVNQTEEIGDQTGETVDETVDVVNETVDVVNETSDVVDETGETVANVTGGTGDDLLNISDSVTGIVGGTDVSLVAQAADLAGDASVGGDGTLGVSVSGGTSDDGWTLRIAGTASTGDPGSVTTSSGRSNDPASSPAQRANASGMVGADSGGNPGASGGSASDGSASNSGRPSPGGAAIGGALIVTAVGAAAASKHVAASTAVAQGEELVWAGRVVRARASTSFGGVKAQLGRLPRLVFPFGYSRHDDSDPLEHEVRASLFDAVERSPGVNLSTLADGVDVSLSSVRHHLRILEEEHLVVGERIRGQRRYFPRNEANPELVAALDDPSTAPILTTLATRGPTSVSDLADQLGRDPSTISHHVSRLEDDGLIERERDGRTVLNDLAPVASRVMAQGTTGQERPVATE